MKKSSAIAIVAAAFCLASAFAQDIAPRRETVGVDGHYESSHGNDTWSGSLSYGRIVMANLEVAGAYTFDGQDGGSHSQGLQLIGRQWFGTFGRPDSFVPFIQIGAGFEFANSQYESVYGAGVGLGLFPSAQADLRLTLKRDWGGFAEKTRLDVGYFYHF